MKWCVSKDLDAVTPPGRSRLDTGLKRRWNTPNVRPCEYTNKETREKIRLLEQKLTEDWPVDGIGPAIVNAGPNGWALLRLSGLLQNDTYVGNGAGCMLSAAWVEFLCQRADHAALEQAGITTDEVFHRVGPRPNSLLQPRTRGIWSRDTTEWGEVLPWLKYPERLTRIELELALAVFDWDEPSPRLTAWLRKQRSGLLPIVHRYLLKHFCWDLLRVFKIALKRDGLWMPPYRAGELTTLNLRIVAMVTLGIVGFYGADALRGALYPASHEHAAFLAIVLGAAWIVLHNLLRREVFRHNHGLIDSESHARPRVWCFHFHVIAWAFVLSLFLAVIVTGDSLERAALAADWCALGGWSMSVSLQAVAGAAMGILLQGLWDSHSALDAD